MPYQLTATLSDADEIPRHVKIAINKIRQTSPLTITQNINEELTAHLRTCADYSALYLALELDDVDESDLNIDDLTQTIISMNNLISFSVVPLSVNSKKLMILLTRCRIAAIRNYILKITRDYLDRCLTEYKRISDIEQNPEKQKEKIELSLKGSTIFKFTGTTEPIKPAFKSIDEIQDLKQKFDQEITSYCHKLTEQLIQQCSSQKQNLDQLNLFKGIYHYLNYAEMSWKKIVHILYNDLFQGIFQLPESITHFNLTQIAYTDYEVNKTLLNYVRNIRKDIKEVSYLQPKQLRVVNKIKQIHKTSLTQQSTSHNIWTYQEVAISDTVNQVKSFIKNILRSYQQSFRIGNDRQVATRRLKKDIKESNDLHCILGFINTEFNQSFQADFEYNQNHSSLLQRKAFSRYRQNLLSCKSWLFSVCPPSQILTMVRTENYYLPSLVDKELNRGADYYEDHRNLKSLIIDMLTDCRNDTRLIENQIEQSHLEDDTEYDNYAALLLAKKLSYLQRIRNHPDYDARKCGLAGIYQSLCVLYQRTKTFLPAEQQRHLQACKTISKALNKMKIQSPSIFCLFSDSFYTIPAENEFNVLLTHINNAKTKFYIYEAMSLIKKHLTDKYGAENIKISYCNVTASQLDIELELVNKQTLCVNKLPLLIHIDAKQNKYVVEPKINFVSNTLSKQYEMSRSM